MDPNATIALIVHAVLDGRGRDARDSIRDLNEWLDKGGFAPSPNMPALTELPPSTPTPSEWTAKVYTRLQRRVAELLAADERQDAAEANANFAGGRKTASTSAR